MISQSWVIILSVSFFITTMCFLVAIIFLLFASIEIRKASGALREFLKTTEQNLRPVVAETEEVLKTLQKVGSNVGAVTEDVRSFSAAVADLAVNVKTASSLIGTAQEALSLRAQGLKAGFRAAVEVLTKREGRS
jgi:uncharacterized protein YoxC